jgi:OOP family OmpA-OmpF porin
MSTTVLYAIRIATISMSRAPKAMAGHFRTSSKITRDHLRDYLISCGPAVAQSEAFNSSWYIMPSVNTFKPDSSFGVDRAGEGVGLRMGKPLSQSWDLQFGPNFARANANGLRYEQTMLGADGLYMFSRERFKPFLLIGAGAERDKFSGVGSDTIKTSPYINAGLGFQYAFSDQWSTQVDFRRVHGYLRDNIFGFDRSNNNYVTVGLAYAFDKPAQPARTPPPPVAVVEPAPVAVAPPPPPAPVRVAPAPRFERYTLSSTELFAFDSAELRLPQPKLDEIASLLKANPTADNAIVTGYADRLGSKKYNQKLSLRRAESVKDYLISQGVESGRISAAGKGEEDPVVVCKEKKRAALIECLEPNRRVEVDRITGERRVN